MIVKLTQKCWDKLARIMREKFTDDDSSSMTSHHFSIYLDLDIPSFSHEQLKGLVTQLKELGHTAIFYFDYSSDLVFQRWVQANGQLIQAHADMFVNLINLRTQPIWHAISDAYSKYTSQHVRPEIFKELLAAGISELADASELSPVDAQHAILTQLINYIYIAVTIADNVAAEKSNVLLYSGTLPAIIRQIIFGDHHLNQILRMLNRPCPTIMHLKSEFETVMVEEQVGAVSSQKSNDRPLSPAAQMADEVMKRVIVTLLETGASLRDVHNLNASFQNRSKTSPGSSPPKHASSFGVFHTASSGNDTSSNDFSRGSESFSSPTRAVSSIQSAPASLQNSPEKNTAREGRKTPTSGRVTPVVLFSPSLPTDDNDYDSDQKKVKKMRASVDADSSQQEDSSDDITIELNTATRTLRATSSSGN